ncbi:MAG: hypothetical protein ACRCWI_08130, partial [Brevinema sp.]
ILCEMAKMITSLKTVGSPSTQTLDPSLILEWEVFVEQEIKEMFAPISNTDDDLHQLETPPKGDYIEEDIEENCLGELKDEELEGVVYKFQPNISWDGVDLKFKGKVIKAMRKLYCDYRSSNREWTILEISSAYRDDRRQAQAMVDHQLAFDRHQLVDVYANRYGNALQLISNLFYNDNHLRCDGMCLVTGQSVCEYGVYQKSLLILLSQKEQEVFTPYSNKDIPFANIKLKGNREKIKDLLELWIKASGFKSPHTSNKALDFSRKNIGQRDEFKKILENDKIILSSYKAGYFHIQPSKHY